MSTINFLIVFVVSYLYKNSNAAITPLDVNYQATAERDFPIPWTFDNEADMDTVDWSFKSPSAATPVIIMTKSPGSQAAVTTGYDVVHDTANGNGNGGIRLQSVTANETGIYYCTVTYSFSSSLPVATGTATLMVTSATTTATPDTATPDTDDDIGAIIGGVLGGVVGACLIGVGVYLLWKKVGAAAPGNH